MENNGMGNEVLKKLKKREKKNKRRIILIVVLAVLVLGGVYISNQVKKAGEAMMEVMASMQTEEVSVRSLIKSVGATGTVISVQKEEVTAALSGVDVLAVNVEIGDSVTEGQELVVFDTSDIEDNLTDAQKALSDAKQKIKLTSEDLTRNVVDAERNKNFQIDTAQNTVDDAYSAYEEALEEYEDSIEEIEDLEDKEDDYEDDLEDAEKKLSEAEAKYDECKKAAESNPGETTQTALEEAETHLESVKAEVGPEIEALKTKYNETYAARKAEEQKANKLYDAVEAAEEAYNKAVKTYDNTVASQTSTVASAKSNQASTGLNLNTSNEEKLVEQYEKELNKGILKAPISGIVTDVMVDVGDTYTQGAILTIQDCSSFEVEAYIGEYDISDIKKGQKVLIKTDATGDEELEGTVVFVSPTGTKSATANDVTYKIRISIDTPNERLRLDMSASLSIIIEQHENVMTVPYNAVQEDEDGNSFVEVVDEAGAATAVPVEVVLESNYYTEIKADSLEEGQKVRVIDSENGFNFEIMMGPGGF